MPSYLAFTYYIYLHFMQDLSAHAASIFDRLAQLYADKYMDVAHYYPALQYFLQHCPLNADLLELGCGPGNVTVYLRDSRPDISIFATDLAPSMVALARKNVPGVRTGILDCRKISTLPEKFDAVMASFVLPYLSRDEVRRLIEDAGQGLRDRGILYLSTMEAGNELSGWESGSKGDQVYINYYEYDFLRQLLNEHGFEVLDKFRVAVEDHPKVKNDLILIAKKAGGY